MERRKFLIGAGSLAAGGAAALGSGAFTSVEADRTVSVSVADDSDAFLRFVQSGDTNSAYVEEQSDGQITVNLDAAADVSGSGINADARTILFELFSVQNQGTQPVVVYTPTDEYSIGGDDFDPSSGDYIDVQANNRPNGDYTNSNQKDDEISLSAIHNEHYVPSSDTFEQAADNIYSTGSNNSGLDEFKLGVGESFDFGLWLEEDGDGSFDNVDLTITADATLL